MSGRRPPRAKLHKPWSNTSRHRSRCVIEVIQGMMIGRVNRQCGDRPGPPANKIKINAESKILIQEFWCDCWQSVAKEISKNHIKSYQKVKCKKPLEVQVYPPKKVDSRTRTNNRITRGDHKRRKEKEHKNKMLIEIDNTKN